MIYIQVSETIQFPFEHQVFEKAALAVLEFTQQSTEVDLSLVFSDDLQLQQLNREFLGFDAPTDVLSFPAHFIDPDSGRAYLGDVLISVPRAAEQARLNQKSLQSELLLLTVHGILHLLGYDHAEKEQQEQMWKIQDEILSRLESG